VRSSTAPPVYGPARERDIPPCVWFARTADHAIENRTPLAGSQMAREHEYRTIHEGAMAQRTSFTGLSVEDISVDRRGRVAVTNPRVAERLKAVAQQRKRPKPKAPNTNCGLCNTVKGCGPTNATCHPNTVSNCGCPPKTQ